MVRLMGIVSNMSAKTADHIPRAPFVIMELMAKGDLKSYLRSMRPEEDDNHVPENYPVLPVRRRLTLRSCPEASAAPSLIPRELL